VPKESPFVTIHRSSGAKFSEENGWLLPSHFEDPLREYQAVRSEVGLIDLCHRGILRFTGPDQASFLQGMVSNDVKALADGDGAAAAILNVQGKILADTRVLCGSDFMLLDLWEFLKDKILDHLNRYLIADEVEITDLTAHWGTLSFQGPKARSFLTELFDDELPTREYSHRTVSIDGAPVRVVRSTYTGEEGYDLLTEVESLSAILARIEPLTGKFSARWIGTKALETLRVEAAIPRYGTDMDENTLLPEARLERAVSFQKGCYLGQEVVERIRSRGHVNRRLAGMVLEGDSPAEHNDSVHSDNKEVGKVTSSVFSPFLDRPIALGYIHRNYLEPGTPLLLHHQSKTIQAKVAPLPFYRMDRS
jgi:folate-binding protein YgfZ